MIVTRDRAEGFALRAFAAAWRAKKEKGLVFHHGEISLIPRKELVKQAPSFRAKPRNPVELPSILQRDLSTPKAFVAQDGEAVTPGSHSPVVRRDRSARSRQSEQRL